jgi:hypothetical protein
MLLCCDYITSDEARYNLGWVLTGFVLLNIVLNFLNVIIKMVQKVIEFLKLMCLKVKKCREKAKKGGEAEAIAIKESPLEVESEVFREKISKRKH